jgi:hypothetical protein
MELRQIYDSIGWDIFTGDGWTNWTRVTWDKGILSHVNGIKLGRDEKRELIHRFKSMERKEPESATS